MKMEIYACMECGTKREIWRRDGQLRKMKHQKKMYCAGCHHPKARFEKIE